MIEYLTELRRALDGPRGDVLRRMLAPDSDTAEHWPPGAIFYAEPGAGFVIVDGDLRGLFATDKGRGARLVALAIDMGARTLNHYDCDPLNRLYNGFREIRREPNWTPGGPDVIYRERTDA